MNWSVCNSLCAFESTPRMGSEGMFLQENDQSLVCMHVKIVWLYGPESGPGLLDWWLQPYWKWNYIVHEHYLKQTFSSHRLALALISAAPPEMTPLFWNRVPSRDTAYTITCRISASICTWEITHIALTSTCTMYMFINIYSHACTCTCMGM